MFGWKLNVVLLKKAMLPVRLFAGTTPPVHEALAPHEALRFDQVMGVCALAWNVAAAATSAIAARVLRADTLRGRNGVFN